MYIERARLKLDEIRSVSESHIDLGLFCRDLHTVMSQDRDIHACDWQGTSALTENGVTWTMVQEQVANEQCCAEGVAREEWAKDGLYGQCLARPLFTLLGYDLHQLIASSCLRMVPSCYLVPKLTQMPNDSEFVSGRGQWDQVAAG